MSDAWVAIFDALQAMLEAPVCSSPAINYNPTMENAIKPNAAQNLFCLAILMPVRERTGEAIKDTTATLRYFPGAPSSDAELSDGLVTITPNRLRWHCTGFYAKPGVPFTLTLLGFDEASPRKALSVQAGRCPQPCLPPTAAHGMTHALTRPL